MFIREKQYIGINALVGLTFAEYEKCMIGQIIQDATNGVGTERVVPVESVVKMIVGAMMTPFDRVPLYRFDKMYASAPVDLLFGENVTLNSLNPSSISRALDILFRLDMEDVLWKCARSCNDINGLNSDIYHVDATNFAVYALTENVDTANAPAAMYCGSSKIGRNDLRHYGAMAITDGNRILRYLKAYSGNTSDVTMDREIIEFMKERIDPTISTVVADCKIVTTELINEMVNFDVGFISKCPINFSNCVKDSMLYSVMNSYLDESSLGEGYGFYDTDIETICGTLRFIAYKTPHDREDGLKFLREDGERRLLKAFSKFQKAEYNCKEDAENAFYESVRNLKEHAYRLTYTVDMIERVKKRESRGRPRKNSPPPEKETIWTVTVEYEFDFEKANSMIDEDEIQVLVTNLPRSTKDKSNIRFGATADTVIKTYLDEYKAEHTYRLLKSGIGMDKVYLHKGSRVAAMIFIAGIAGMLSSTMDAVLRRGNADTTTYLMKLDLADATVRLKRSTGYTYIDGHDGVGSEIQEYCEILNIEPDSMLGIYSN